MRSLPRVHEDDLLAERTKTPERRIKVASMTEFKMVALRSSFRKTGSTFKAR
jgi:hypothetical protein